MEDRDEAPAETEGLPWPAGRARVSGSEAGTRARASPLQDLQRPLDLIAGDAPLEQSLDALVRFVEGHSDMRCAVLLWDRQSECLRIAAAPNVPEDYRASIAPFLRVIPGVASCGMAAMLRQPVYIRDIATDQFGEPCGQIAVRNGLRAVWSTPIHSKRGFAIGAFAMYYEQPRLPTDEHIQLVGLATRAARIALEVQADKELLRAAFEESPGRALVVDVADGTVRANRAFAELLGYEPGELAGKTLAEISASDGPTPCLPAQIGEVITGTRRYRTRDGALVTVRERSTARRGPSNACYVISRIDQINPTGDDPLGRLSPRELEVLRFVAAGHTSKDIAVQLRISPASVDTYRSRLMNKLDLDHLGEVMRFAIEHGLTETL